jgi:hypothetical protein
VTAQSSIEQVFAHALYFGSTESMVPWEWLQDSRDKRFLMTEHERVAMLLKAVNGESFAVPEWARLCGAPLLDAEFVIKKDGKMLDVVIPLFVQAKTALRSALTGIIDEADAAVPTITKNLREILRGRVLTVPDESTLGVPRDRVIAHSPGAALAYALRLVLDPNKPFRRQLRQCTYSDCGNFALVKPPSTRGKPRDYFCSAEHDAEHAKKQGRERKRKQRSRAK